MSLAALAGTTGLSVFHFARQFKQATGRTPHTYITELRIARADFVADNGIADRGDCAALRLCQPAALLDAVSAPRRRLAFRLPARVRHLSACLERLIARELRNKIGNIRARF